MLPGGNDHSDHVPRRFDRGRDALANFSQSPAAVGTGTIPTTGSPDRVPVFAGGHPRCSSVALHSLTGRSQGSRTFLRPLPAATPDQRLTRWCHAGLFRNKKRSTLSGTARFLVQLVLSAEGFTHGEQRPPQWNTDAPISRATRRRPPSRGWSLSTAEAAASGRGQPDATWTLRSLDGASVEFVVRALRSVLPRELPEIVQRIRPGQALPLIAAPYLSQRAQDVLTDLRASYGDSTGNLRLTADRPALFFEGQGATKDPGPPGRYCSRSADGAQEGPSERSSTSARRSVCATSPSARACRSVHCPGSSACSTAKGS